MQSNVICKNRKLKKKTEQNECKNTESVQLKQKILQMETITNMAHHTSHNKFISLRQLHHFDL